MTLVLVSGMLTGCFATSGIAVDEIDAPVFARDGAAPETDAALAEARALAESSPTYRAQVGRFEGTPVEVSDRPLAELLDYGLEVIALDVPLVESPTDLVSLVALLRNQNLSVARAAEGVRRSDIERDNAALALAPRISGDIDFGRVEERTGRTGGAVGTEGNFDRTILRVEATQPLYDGAAAAARDAAERGLGISRAAFAAETQGAIFELVDVYLRAAAARARSDLTRRRLASVDAQRSAENRLRAAGRSAAAAALVLDVERGSAQADLALLDQEFEIALSDLSRLVGRPFVQLEPYAAPSSAFAPIAQTALIVATALDENPLLLQRRLETVRRRDLYREAVARDFLPRVEAYASADYEAQSGSAGRIGTDTEEYAVGIRVNIPIYNRTGTGYAHRVAESAYRDAALSEVALRRQLRAEIVALATRVNEGIVALSGARRSLDAARALVAAERVAVEAGQSAPAAIVARQIQLLRAEESVLLRRFEILRAQARLAYLSGVDPLEVLT